MPITFKVDRERNIIFTTCKDKITVQEFFEHQRENGSDRSLFGYDEILDVRQADFSAFNHLALQSIAQATGQLAAIDTNTSIAVLVDEGGTKEIVELYQMVENIVNGGGRKMQVFSKLEDAEKWLNESRAD